MSSSDEVKKSPSTARRGANRFKSMRSANPASAKSRPGLGSKGNTLTNSSVRLNQAAAAVFQSSSRQAPKAQDSSDEEPVRPSRNSGQAHAQADREAREREAVESQLAREREVEEQERRQRKEQEKRERRERREAKSNLAKYKANAASNSHLASNLSIHSREQDRTPSVEDNQSGVSHQEDDHSGSQNLQVASSSRTVKSSSKKTEKLAARINDLDQDLKERGEQILKLRKENRSLQGKLDEANDAISMEKATHEKIMNDLQNRSKRQVDAAKREIARELEESQETISDLTDQLKQVSTEAKKATSDMAKYKSEADKTNERLATTSAQLVDMSAQCQKLTDTAINREKDNKSKIDQQRQNNVQSEEMMQNYQKQIYELQLELEQAKNDTSLQSEVGRLRSEVGRISEENDDLKGQLLKANISRAKELASGGSLAAEIDTVDKSCSVSIDCMEQVDDTATGHYKDKIEKLNKDLLKSKKEHDELKVYLDKIIMSIIEKDPSILEVK